MAESIDLMGEGGAVIRFSLPLSDVYADQLAKGRLRPVDEAGKATVAEPVAEEAPEFQGPPPKVGPGSGREEWAKYADSLGIDASGMGRAEIIAAIEADEEE